MTTEPDTILIVDDHPTNLAVLFEVLERAGFNVRIATNGETALESVHHLAPDLILLDVRMPGIDGFETCRQLKAQPETSDIPVIFMTALSEVADEVTGFSLGAVDYITKPIVVEIVIARIKTHLTIRRLQRWLQEQNAALDAYARTVAHDLKNPLGCITTCADYLIDHWAELDDNKLLSYLQILQTSGHNAMGIIDELLLLASAQRGDILVQPINMGDVFRHAQEQIEFMLMTHRGSLHAPRTWPSAYGYAPWIEAVWVNYLSNAIKYGGHPPRLEVGASPQSDGMIRFWVHDNGAGIPAESQRQLFIEWTRLEGSHVHGHGIGLALVRRIIERLGGHVGVESTIGKGSTFYFCLPADPQEIAKIA